MNIKYVNRSVNLRCELSNENGFVKEIHKEDFNSFFLYTIKCDKPSVSIPKSIEIHY